MNRPLSSSPAVGPSTTNDLADRSSRPKGLFSDVGETWRLAWPLMMARMATVLLGMADTITFGLLGADALAAGGLAVAIFLFIHIVCIGILSATGNQVAWAYGKRDEAGIRAAVEAGLLIALGIGLGAGLLLLGFEPALLALGQDPGLTAGAMTYLSFAALSFVPSLVFIALRGLTVGLGRPGPTTAIALSAVAVKVALNALLFLPVPLPVDGLAWVGLSTALTYLFMGAAMTWHARRHFARYLRLPTLMTPRHSAFREGIALGLPIGATFGIEAGMFSGVALIVGTLGAVPLAAHHVANEGVYLSFMIAVGFSQACSMRVGKAAGAGRLDEARRIGFQALVLGLMAMTVTATAFALFGRELAILLVSPASDAEWAVVDLAASLLLIAALFQWVDGTQNIAMGALRGLKDPRSTMTAALIGYWMVGLSLAAYLSLNQEQGALGAWIGIGIGLLTAAVLLILRFERMTRPDREPDTAPPPPDSTAT